MVLADSGINPERFAIDWVSSAEAPRFAEVVIRFTEKIKALGPCEVKLEEREEEKKGPNRRATGVGMQL